MARRAYEDPYEREMRDRRGQIPREQERRDRNDPRDQRQMDNREQDRMDYTRENRLDQRPLRDNALRPVYSYADQNDRDESPHRGGYIDDPRERHRQLIDLQSGRSEDPTSRYQEYFLPGEGINREVIQYDICRYLGNDATVRPYTHPDGRQGYLIKAYRPPTTPMITTLKQDSKRFEVESAQRRRQFGQSSRYGEEPYTRRSPNADPGVSYSSSTTFDDRQRQGRPDVRPEVNQSGYAGYGMDTTMDDYDDRGPLRNYRDQEPRIDTRPDPRQQLPINRHGLPVSQGFPQDPAYPSSYQVQPVSSGYYDPATSQPRTLGPNSTPPPPMGRSNQTIYAGGYPVTTSASYSIPASVAPGGAPRFTDTANGRIPVGYPGSVPYTQERHAGPRRQLN